MELEIESKIFSEARKKRNSCIHFRRDFGQRMLAQPVCSRIGFAIPSLKKCTDCNDYADCLDSPAPSMEPKSGNKKENPRGRIVQNVYRRWKNSNPIIATKCSVCGADFLTRNPSQTRCDGVCANSLNRFIVKPCEKDKQAATRDYIHEMLVTKAVN